jgi:hypothetical protein
MTFNHLRRCQLDIEVASPGGDFPHPARAADRVLAIGLRGDGRNRLLLLEDASDAGEKALLERFAIAHSLSP